MKTLLFLAFAAACWAQPQGSAIRISPAPVDQAFTRVYHYTSNTPDYVCTAFSTQNVSTISVSTISNANPGVMTATAHGIYFATGVAPKIVTWISGLTGNWVPLNGGHILSPASANSLTTDVDTTSFGAVTGTIVVSTRAPKITANVWSVQSYLNDASNNPTYFGWSAPVPTSLANLAGGQTSPGFPCSAPTTAQ